MPRCKELSAIVVSFTVPLPRCFTCSCSTRCLLHTVSTAHQPRLPRINLLPTRIFSFVGPQTYATVYMCNRASKQTAQKHPTIKPRPLAKPLISLSAFIRGSKVTGHTLIPRIEVLVLWHDQQLPSLLATHSRLVLSLSCPRSRPRPAAKHRAHLPRCALCSCLGL